MSISPADIIRLMQRPRAGSSSPGKLLKRLGLTRESADELEAHLAVLEAAGVVHRRRDGSVALRKGGNFVTGALDVTRKGVGFLRQDDADALDIYLGRGGLGAALDGDQVVVEQIGRAHV